ncbi:MAG: Aa [Gammaproteobacteria bacterium]|jgi:3-phenylpropionate/trans-cinnamate dioxygenase ferredoxin reductase subunit|nr:Aa [Gammaproteobacteria bacterium]
MVIVGAGEAGTRAALSLRQSGWPGAITLIGQEDLPPYERPPLSKKVLTCATPIVLETIANAEGFAADKITYLPGTTVCEIDRIHHRVALLQTEREFHYDRLLLTTGASARKLALESHDGADIHYLRTFADALKIRAELSPGKRILVIGGGFIGLEIAASARTVGADVTVVEMAPRILGRGVPQNLAKLIHRFHAEQGVPVFEGIGVTRFEPAGRQTRAHLSNGVTVNCDAIVAGVGAVPNTALAESAGVVTENGIRVDSCLRTNDPDIFAAGDCCSFPHVLYGNRRIRLEAWRNAQTQGQHAAASLMGADTAYSAVPSFWSDHYDRTLLICGFTDEPNSTTVERNLGGVNIQFHLASDGRLLGASAFGPNEVIAREMRIAELLIERCASPGGDRLADPAVKLKSLLRAG